MSKQLLKNLGVGQKTNLNLNKMKKLLFFFLISPFALFANDAIVSDEVLKTVEKHFEKNNNDTQSLNPLHPCYSVRGRVTCSPPCSGGSVYVATLPENTSWAAYEQYSFMVSSVCGSCNFSVGAFDLYNESCITLP
jgi:hypothetical protein